MLVLSRNTGESVMIGDNIEIYVAGIRDGHVKLSFNAPKEVLIYRKEIWNEIQKEKNNKE